ncbi:hypothetical protein EYF80_029242 [Liparis tanakae]|uniref:Uncharacterized protein n=1 Tax=Liparis tanakae TaxID=230148 RepID=A0A4Z2H436_9TELE|nr:hypothetical protein EYF80_029242 [Liparis tanakae]
MFRLFPLKHRGSGSSVGATTKKRDYPPVLCNQSGTCGQGRQLYDRAEHLLPVCLQSKDSQRGDAGDHPAGRVFTRSRPRHRSAASKQDDLIGC